jgi:hypothetical protein
MLELEKALKNAIDQTRKASYDKLKIDESDKLKDKTKIDESDKLEDQTKIDESDKLELSNVNSTEDSRPGSRVLKAINVNSTEDSRPGSRVLKAIGAKWTAKYTQKE